jgi:ABC-type transport system substrate-binding protein
MDRREWLAATAALAAAGPAGAAPPRDTKTLRWAFRVAETGFDPPQIADANSAMVAASIFESPLTYDYLARPVKLRLQTAAAMPEVASDFRSFTFRIRPGIFFADDPAFGGRPRELVAQDYVYTIKRFYDPRLKSEHLYVFQNAKVLGLSELREKTLKTQRPFDYDTEVEGLRALDRYTFRVRLAEPSPRLPFDFAIPGFTGAVAREVVEAYGDDIADHPVGTGPFRLGAWRRGSSIELLRNPRFREQVFEAEPAPGDTEAEAIARQLAGKRLPLVDRVEISVIIEAQPRFLAFSGGALDVLEVPTQFTPLAIPNGKIAPHLGRKGVIAQTALQPDMQHTFFNMDDPVVGGLSAEKVALRRAIALALDEEERLRLLSHGQGIPAQSVVAPATSGYDPDYRSTMSEYSPARAKALLDLYGYVDRDGDGWRELPDGRPLVLRLACAPDQRSRAINELWRKWMNAVGLQIRFDIANWPDLLKMSRAGSMMMWSFVWMAQSPDGSFFLGIAYGPNSGESNDSHFKLPAYDRLFERQRVLPDGPEREALMREAKNLLAAYMPYKAHLHYVVTDLVQPWVRGHWRHPFMRDLWRYVGIDPSPA